MRVLLAGLAATVLSLAPQSLNAQQQPVLTGQNAFTNYKLEKPGVRRHLTLADLPAPAPDTSVDNGAQVVARPKGAWPIAPAGFKVTLYAGGDNGPIEKADLKKEVGPVSHGTFRQPRLIMTAPNGDLFVADSAAGTVFVLRGVSADGKAERIEKFATGLDHPFGIAFYPRGGAPQWVYIANTTSVVRFPYKPGDMKATAPPQTIVPTLPGYAQLRGGGHWTRDVVFSLDGKHMLVSVGSGSNVDNADTHPREFHRADILEYTPDGKFEQVFAHGIRNCVGEAVNPTTGQLWCSTNERDQLGNNLVPDYITSVPVGSFFGWPWYYMGGHQDPRLPQPCADGTGPNPQRAAPLTEAEGNGCKHVDMASQVRTPDVILQPHFASLEMTFYPSRNALENIGRAPDAPGKPPIKGGMNLPTSIFPARYIGDAFAAEHGSWNREPRAGYEVIRIPMKNGHATGEYEDFLTGFTLPDGKVWGRPVGVAVGNDGSLFVSDDGSRSIWRVAYTGK